MLETGMVGVNGYMAEVEEMKEQLELEFELVGVDVDGVGDDRDDEGVKRVSARSSRDWEMVDETWFLSFFTLFFMKAAADVEKAGWWRSTV